MMTEKVTTDLRPAGVRRLPGHEGAGVSGRVMHSLRQCEGELHLVVHQTEEAFLIIGSVLRDFYDRARKISDMSSAVAALMTGTEIVGSIDDLNGLLEKMEAYLRHSEAETDSRTETLHEILRLMGVIGEPLENLQRITKTLKSLHITSRIQYSPLMERNTELKVLLDDVKKLSEIMTQKSQKILEDLKSLECSVGDALSRFLLFKKEQQGRTRAVLDHTISVLCSITGQYGLSTKAAQDISERSAAISRSTGEIVTSVQFHDIVRQRFERIRKGLYYATERGVFMAEGQVFGAEDDGGADPLAGIAGLCRDAASEVFSTGRTLMTAVGGISDNLRSIAVNVLTMSADAQKIGGLDKADKKTLLTEAEHLLSSVTASFAALSENADASRELSQTLFSLAGATTEMAGFTGEIEEIAEDVELIAFNTEIKSAQLGTAGAAFEIVAESIRKLSAETYTQAKAVSELLGKIAAAADELSACAGPDSGGPLRGPEDISADFERLIATFSRLNRSIVSLFAEIEKAGHALSGDIEKTAGGINVHTAVDRVVTRVVSSLKDAAAHTGVALPAGRASVPRWAEAASWTSLRAGGNGTLEEDKGNDDGVEFFQFGEGRTVVGDPQGESGRNTE